MTVVRRLYLGGMIVALAAGGCATARAKAQPEPPALEVPAPPPRVIVPPDPEPAQQQPTPTPEPETPQQKPARRPAPQRSDVARSEKKVDAPPVVETVSPAIPPPATPPTARAMREK